jgi:hypothetical protein
MHWLYSVTSSEVSEISGEEITCVARRGDTAVPQKTNPYDII